MPNFLKKSKNWHTSVCDAPDDMYVYTLVEMAQIQRGGTGYTYNCLQSDKT